MTRIATCFGIALALTGCATEEEVTGDLDRSLVHVEKGALEIVQTDDLAVGVYDDGKTRIEFRSERPTHTDLDIELVLNEMMVTVTVDYMTGAIEYDGFALEDGSETQMLDDDRMAIYTLNRALEQLDERLEAADQLTRFTSTWSEYPTTLSLKGHTAIPMDRAYTSVCSLYGSYQQATHDCWGTDRWDDDTTYYGYLYMHAPGPCSDDTWFYDNGTWRCFEPDHSSSIEYSYGACFGRCGGGCGSSTQFTWDCHDHDSCVRFGHSLASFWCDDEFSSTVDDWASAPDCL